MIQELIIGVITSIIGALIITSFSNKKWFIRYIYCILIHRNKELRISFSSILKISRDEYYLLVRSIRRPEVFGPFGGVYKYFESALPVLDQYDFRPQTPKGEISHIMKNDLRGFIPCKNLFKFMRWFKSGKDREIDCLTRELEEELKEIGLEEVAEKIKIPKYRLIRTIQEGPIRIQGYSYTQFRFFHVYEFIPRDPDGQEIIDLLFEKEKYNQNLLIATSEEIIKRRTVNGDVIGTHTGYLFGHKLTGPEPPPF